MIDTELTLRELRCLKCRALLMKERIHSGAIEIVCWRGNCGTINRYTFNDIRFMKREKNNPLDKIKVAGDRDNNNKKEV